MQMILQHKAVVDCQSQTNLYQFYYLISYGWWSVFPFCCSNILSG